jgi:pleiotropic regulator 1
MNKVIRNYHGHLSGVYCLKIHEGLGVLISGGRDSTARVWDVRVRKQVHALVGHSHTVGSILTQDSEPNVITGSYDSFIKTWDIGQGRCVNTLTNHKKSVRALVEHPTEYTFASAASDNIKVWKCPNGNFLRNISGHHSIIDAMAVFNFLFR